MKVGNLVRHQMYNESKAPALVLKVGRHGMIKILDPGIGWFGTWDSARGYEVISEGR